jgi:hypothetical protein
MSWPLPIFSKIEYPTPISVRLWLPMLTAIALATIGAVLLLWPPDKSTHTFQFWSTLFGTPLVVCALMFGLRLNIFEDERVDAEEAQVEQQRLGRLWRDWTRRHLPIVDVVAFPAGENETIRFADIKIALQRNNERSLTFEWVKNGHGAAFRRTRLLHLIARRFSAVLRGYREIFVTLMLDDESLKDADAWMGRTKLIFRSIVPGSTFHVEAKSAREGARWITQQIDRIDSTARLVIAAQLWSSEVGEHKFSEGAAAFLVGHGVANVGSIYRPMVCAGDALDTGLAQIKDIQMSPEQLKHVWTSGCEYDESTAIRSTLTSDPKDMPLERVLDDFLGNPGPASGWIALAIAMESTRGAGPQIVVWRDAESAPLHLCTISPLPLKETTV